MMLNGYVVMPPILWLAPFMTNSMPLAMAQNFPITNLSPRKS